MARRRSEDENIRKLNRTKRGSVLVRLPPDIVRSLGWRDKQKVVISKSGKTITIKDWKE